MVFSVITALCAAFFTGMGIYAWKRKKPMWFWSGSSVSENDISDVAAYNRANGIMWICYSALFWVSAALGLKHTVAGGVVLILGCLIGTPALIFAYDRIFNRYKKKIPGGSLFDFDPERQKPVIRASICTGEQVAGFKDKTDGSFHEVMLIRDQKDLDSFMKTYGLEHVDKEY